MPAPHVNTDYMNAHLRFISEAVGQDAHAILVLDQAGWHTTKDLKVPDNLTLLPLPADFRGQPPAQRRRTRLGLPEEPPPQQPRLPRLRPPVRRGEDQLESAHPRAARLTYRRPLAHAGALITMRINWSCERLPPL